MTSTTTATCPATPAVKTVKRFVGSKRRTAAAAGELSNPSSSSSNTSATPAKKHSSSSAIIASQIPLDILQNPLLNSTLKASLPSNYNFEVHKILWHIRKNGIGCGRANGLNEKGTVGGRVALQFPEGLMMFACTIADILKRFGQVETLIMGDVTYGACCIDDYTARALGCELLVHFGHSCLVPVDVTTIKTLYVFVDIGIDIAHFVDTIKHNFLAMDEDHSSSSSLSSSETKTLSKSMICLVATIQFVTSLQAAKLLLQEAGFDVLVPQARPLSPGEILGCTAPKIPSPPPPALPTIIVYLGDGRFHLESIMMANPLLPAFRYDPYNQKFTREIYEHGEMRALRARAVEVAKMGINNNNNGPDEQRGKRGVRWGLILGTLGRQGSEKVMQNLQSMLSTHGIDYTTILLSEIFPAKLSLLNTAFDAFVQIACPRLSIDWGYAFEKPLLTPYECAVALGVGPMWAKEPLNKEVDSQEKAVQGDSVLIDYPMDFYASDSLGPWTPNHKPPK